MFLFASTIHNRIYLLNERFDLFDIRTHGVEHVEAALAEGHGAFLMGAHLGSFKVVRAIGRAQPHIRIAITMYEENARKINAILAAVNPAAQHDVIGLGKVDAMLKVRERLDSGSLVGMLADRTLHQAVRHAARAQFPRRGCGVFARPAAYGGGTQTSGHLHDGAVSRRQSLRYPLRDVGGFLEHRPRRTRGGRRCGVVALLEKYCRAAPYNWFNYFDFWQASQAEQTARADARGLQVTRDS